jgi:hypothetical protein
MTQLLTSYPTCGDESKEMKPVYQRDTCIFTCSTIHNSQDTESTQQRMKEM